MTQICIKKNPSVLIYTGSYSAFEEINSLMKKSGKEHIRDVILHTLPIVNEKCLLFLNCSIYFESIIHANYYRKLLCIYSSFSLKHVSPPESFNHFFFRWWNLCWGICCHNLYCHCSHSINGRGKSTNTHIAFHLPLHWVSGTLNCVYTHWWELKPLHYGFAKTHWFRLSPFKAHKLFTKKETLTSHRHMHLTSCQTG